MLVSDFAKRYRDITFDHGLGQSNKPTEPSAYTARLFCVMPWRSFTPRATVNAG
jgi:hypothetical protein